MRSAVASAGVVATGACSSAAFFPALADASGDAGGVTTNVADHGNDLRIMYVHQFLAEAEDEITERIINGSYDQLIDYVHGRT